MNQEVEEKVKILADTILASDEYLKYIENRDRLKQDPELFEKVNELRKRMFIMNIESSGEKLYQETQLLREEYYTIRMDERVLQFLQGELILCKIIQRVDDLLTERLDFDLI